MKAYQLLVELQHVEPRVWRRLIVPAEITFKRFHDVVQHAMGWQNYHLFQFQIEREKKKVVEIVGDEESVREFWSDYFYLFDHGFDPDNEFEVRHAARILRTSVKHAHKEKLPDYLEEADKITYMYDFGDNWQHVVTLEQVVEDYQKWLSGTRRRIRSMSA